MVMLKPKRTAYNIHAFQHKMDHCETSILKYTLENNKSLRIEAIEGLLYSIHSVYSNRFH